MENLFEKIKKFEREIFLALVLGVVVSSLLAFWGDVQATVDQLLAFNWWLVLPVLCLTCFNYFLRFLRWHFFLRRIGFRQKITWRKSGLVFLSGLPLTLTPGKTGEVLKAYFLKRIVGDHLSRTIPVVIIERLTDGLGALFLLAFSFYFSSFGWLAPLFVLFVCGVFVLLVYHDPFWCLANQCLSRWGQQRLFWQKIGNKLENFREVLLKLVGWQSLLKATFLASLAWFAESVGFALVITAVGQLSLNIVLLAKVVFIFCFVSILGFVSFLPGGLGVAEGGFVGTLILLLGLSRSQAVAATILLRLLTLWWGVGIGLIAFAVILRYFRH